LWQCCSEEFEVAAITGGERRTGRHATRVVEGTKVPTDITEQNGGVTTFFG